MQPGYGQGAKHAGAAAAHRGQSAPDGADAWFRQPSGALHALAASLHFILCPSSVLMPCPGKEVNSDLKAILAVEGAFITTGNSNALSGNSNAFSAAL